MPKGQGYSYGNSMYQGTKKSSATEVWGNKQTGNTGKAIGDTGRDCPKGNRKTRGAADRYK